MPPESSERGSFHPVSEKVAIVGAGRVGSTYAYTLLLNETVGQIALIDIDIERAKGEAMDLSHSAPLASPVNVCAGSYEECADADIVMIAAGVSQREGESRLDLLKRNADVFGKIVPRVVRANPDAILLVATNPVDVMSYVAWRLSGLPADRVIGSGTVLDTARLRHLLSQHLRVDPRNVHAYVIGEHGESEVAVWSRTSVAGIPLEHYCKAAACSVADPVRDRIETDTRNAGHEIIVRKGATYYAVSAALRAITKSVLLDQRSILPVSARATEAYGLGEIYLSLPSVVGRRGILRTLHLPLSDAEDAALRRSADVLRRALAGMGYSV